MQTSSYNDTNKMKKKNRKNPIAYSHSSRTSHIFQRKNRKGKEEEEKEPLAHCYYLLARQYCQVGIA